MLMQEHIARLETELSVARAQMDDIARTMMEALAASETREKNLEQRLELLETALSNSPSAFADAEGRGEGGIPGPPRDVSLQNTAGLEHNTTNATTVRTGSGPARQDVYLGKGTLDIHIPSVVIRTGTTANKALPPTPLVLIYELSPPMGRPLRRSRTFPPNLFIATRVIDVGVISRPPGRLRDRIRSSASEDGHATGTHVRSTRTVKRKSMIRPYPTITTATSPRSPPSLSRSRALSRSRPRSRTIGAGSKTDDIVRDEAYWALRPAPKRSATEPPIDGYLASELEVEAELQRRGTMSLFTSAQPRRKRTLPVVSPRVTSPSARTVSGPSLPIPPSSPTPSTNRLPSVTKRRPTLSLGPNGNHAAFLANSAVLQSPAPPFSPFLRSPASRVIALESERASSRASSLAAVDNNHQSGHYSIEQTLTVPSSASLSHLSDTPSNPNSASGGPPSPSFEQLVDLLEDLAAKTPNATRPSFESLGVAASRVNSMLSPASPTVETSS